MLDKGLIYPATCLRLSWTPCVSAKWPTKKNRATTAPGALGRQNLAARARRRQARAALQEPPRRFGGVGRQGQGRIEISNDELDDLVIAARSG